MSSTPSLHVAVTGATGFVGRALCDALRARGHVVRALGRASGVGERDFVRIGDIGPTTDWQAALDGIDVVVHAAAITSDGRNRDGSDVGLLQRVNTDGTRRLAEESLRLGVRRLVFLSSIKAVGSSTDGRAPLRPDDPLMPTDAYGESKRDAEIALADVSSRGKLETVIVRPPLVYGPSVRGNFRAIVRATQRGFPLPVGGIENRRSYVGIGNLTSLLTACVESDRAPGHVFHVSDGEDVSTESLIRRIAAALGRPPRIIPVPAGLLFGVGKLLRVHRQVHSLIGSLQVDSTDANRVLGWTPPSPLDAQLDETVRALR